MLFSCKEDDENNYEPIPIDPIPVSPVVFDVASVPYEKTI